MGQRVRMGLRGVAARACDSGQGIPLGMLCATVPWQENHHLHSLAKQVWALTYWEVRNVVDAIGVLFCEQSEGHKVKWPTTRTVPCATTSE